MDELVKALRAGEQADMDGTLVKVSRQACEEAADAIEALQARVAKKDAEIERLRENMRDSYEAFCAMRNDLNEMFGDMISSEATLADGPTMWAECAAVVIAMQKARAALENRNDR
jgi:uncharacterized coiled-coil protein SlyX